MTHIRFGACAALLAAALAAAGCAQTVGSAGPASGKADSGAPAAGPGFATFPDLPMPTRSDIVMNRTLVFGGEQSWIGRLALTTGHGTHDIFSFYQREMPRFGWQEVTSVRSETSVLTYSRGERVATIQIAERTIMGSAVDVTVSPRGAPAAASLGGSGSPPPSPAMPPIQPARGASAAPVSSGALPPPAR